MTNGTATYSPDGQYRYTLTRDFQERPLTPTDDMLAHAKLMGKSPDLIWSYRLRWIMLNPSTATEFEDDPTIRRCIDFSKRWGYGGLVILNIFALRSTNPKALYKADDPIGAGNRDAIEAEFQVPPTWAICAWGSHGEYKSRGNDVTTMLKMAGIKAYCLGKTKRYQPLHPLYLPKKAQLVRYG